mgnify:CR=1 FL=1
MQVPVLQKDITLAVGVTGDVEPMPGPPFAISRIREKSIEGLLEAMGIMVCQEVLPLFRGGWQAGERVVQSRQQDIGWGLG